MSTSPWTFGGESARTSTPATVTLVDGATFMLSDRAGDIDGDAAQGLFMLDTRVLSVWRLFVGGRPVQSLSVTPDGPFSATFVGRREAEGVVDATTVVVQRRALGDGMREDIEIRNHAMEAIDLDVSLQVDADFRSLFDVKAGHPALGGSSMTSIDGGVMIVPDAGVEMATQVDRVAVTSSRPPEPVTSGGVLRWRCHLEPGEVWSSCLQLRISAAGQPLVPNQQCGTPLNLSAPASRLRTWHETTTDFDTSHAVLLRSLHQAVDDLGALRIFDPAHPERPVIAAGAPWFMTLFGRDSLLASWMALPVDQQLAAGVLSELADTQGRRVDDRNEEQPGRILHEVRFDKLSTQMLGGAGRYYGTADATALFVMAVAELARWTGATEHVRSLLPAVDRAVQWIEQYGDRDGDGFVEYERPGDSGLENQGWKDSWDGIRDGDGSVIRAPIALCEVQGYSYAAYRGRAELARAIDGDNAAANRWDERADALREHFDEAFWIDDLGWYAVGLGPDKAKIRSLTSNIGHLLWTGIVPEHRTSRLAELLTSPEMFSGWGLRTLASSAPGYNPLSYHCGSVWPHDTAIAVAGLARARCDSAAQQLAMGLIDSSAWSGGRLPELFAGFARSDLPAPVPYPASCSPQAWAAASPLLIVRALLGLEPDLPAGCVRLRPRLPVAVHHLRLENVPLGSHRLSVEIADGVVDATISNPDIAVLVE